MQLPRTLAYLALLVSSALAGAAEPARVTHISWLSADPPPTADGKSNAGLTGKLVSFMTQQWPEVKHEILQANAKRSWQLIAQGEPVCHGSALRTPEREKLAYFSPTLMGPPLQLIARRDKLAALPLNSAGEVDLARLLADARLQGALVGGRSYGQYIDKALSPLSAYQTLAFYSASDYGSKILPMLLAGRADYTIEQDMALSVGRENNPQMMALVSLPIQGASELIAAGVACPRNAWGLAAIREIDKRLGTPAGAAMLRESFERWLTPELRQRYGAQLDAFYKERARPAVIR
ncbi:MAG: TIGR02285 family protein [Paucibacter sp.]|nr:TIGR02285 family protein [Roseateles sp.]